MPKTVMQKFEDWWAERGRFYDPDTSDVSWFDKRKEFAAYAYYTGINEGRDEIERESAARAIADEELIAELALAKARGEVL